MKNDALMEDVTNSFGRCCLHREFFDRFYEVFMASHPSIAPMFANTDMKRQKQLIRHGIATALMLAAGRKSAELTLARIAHSHGPSGSIQVEPELYPYWRNSLIACVREFDAELTPELEEGWREALDLTIQFILDHYE